MKDSDSSGTALRQEAEASESQSAGAAKARTITGKTKAWFSGEYYGPAEMKEDGPNCVSHVSYFDRDMTEHGWALIGEATITIHVQDDEALVANKVEALRGKATRIRADAQLQLTEIEGKINQLLAITNCVEAA